MKRIYFSLVVIFCFSVFTTKAQTSASKVKYVSQNPKPSLIGAWQSTDGKEFAIIDEDGFFSSIGQDSTGRWASTHAGTYTFGATNALTLTFNVLYSSYSGHIGSQHTVEYRTKGDTLTIKWFRKLVDAKQGDITAQMPKGQQTQYVRAKK